MNLRQNIWLKSPLSIMIMIFFMVLSQQADTAQYLDRSPGWPGETLYGVPCTGKAQGYGPFDYITERNKLVIVERHHFTPPVERLIRGESASVAGDLDYTLRASPNHHRALWAMSRLRLRGIDRLPAADRKRYPYGLPISTPPECYFQRARAFNPSDDVISMVYGIYLHKLGRHDDAMEEYRRAEAGMPGSSELSYNMGLLYVDMGDMEKAQEYASKATSLGYPLKGLHRKIDGKINEQKTQQVQQ